jgi:hypothetical protein
MILTRLALILVVCLSVSAPKAEEPEIQMGYDPSPAYPHGRLHPNAPPQTVQFAFMLGEFDCTDSVRSADGGWSLFPAIWNANYFLNGHGIQDQYWSPRFSTSNIRIFDSKSGAWKVTFFKKPGYGSGVWTGKKEDKNMVMRQTNTSPDGTTAESRLTFHNISNDGFDWVAERVTEKETRASWKSSCRRRTNVPSE